MAKVSGVKKYNRIHRYLREVYLYGFYSREDFESVGIGSTKDYDYWAALIRGIFPDMEDSAVWKRKHKYLRVKRRYIHSGAKRLADTYMLHTIDETEEIPELLCILARLRRGSENIHGLNSAIELLGLAGEDGMTGKYSTTRRRVQDLHEYGSAAKKGKVYSLRKDRIARVKDRELIGLYEYVQFAESVTYPRVAGSFLRRSIEREMLRRGLEPSESEAFLFRHNVNGDVFDEELVYELMSAIRERRVIKLDFGDDERALQQFLPTSLRVDAKLGRWYLLGMGDKPEIHRVSSIQEIRGGKSVEESEWLTAKSAVSEVFSHTGYSGATWERPVRVEAKLNFNRETERGLRNQFIRELRLGGIERREDGEYYVAETSAPRELMPILRAFSPWLKVLPGEHGLDKALRESLQQMRDGVKGDAR